MAAAASPSAPVVALLAAEADAKALEGAVKVPRHALGSG